MRPLYKKIVERSCQTVILTYVSMYYYAYAKHLAINEKKPCYALRKHIFCWFQVIPLICLLTNWYQYKIYTYIYLHTTALTNKIWTCQKLFDSMMVRYSWWEKHINPKTILLCTYYYYTQHKWWHYVCRNKNPKSKIAFKYGGTLHRLQK